MRLNRVFLFLTVFLLALPLPFAFGASKKFYYQDKISDGISVFFLVDLEKGDNIKVWVTPDGDGKFEAFLFDQRPMDSHVQMDRTLDDKIYDEAVQWDDADEPFLNYTAKKDKVYYIQVVLVEDGPDIFTLEANEELTRYYIPAISGFPIELFVFSIVISIGIIALLLRKKII